jgi:hypothetical protein
MAKAYEYRMLEAYPDDLNLNSVAQKILELMAAPGRDYRLSAADLQALKAVYVSAVRGIISRAVVRLQQQPPERSLPFRFELSSSELHTLNRDGQVTIDLSPRILGLSDEENRQRYLADLGVSPNGMTVQVPGSPSGFARVRVVFEHQGRSTAFAGGQGYQFYFGASALDRPFTWGASYDALTGQLDAETLSLAGLSLLRSILGFTPDQTQLFARPAADSMITIAKSQDPQNLGATITRLVLFATVDFHRNRSSAVRLRVRTVGEWNPYIAVDTPDLTNRRDGRGKFTRAFNPGRQVTVTAEPVYGELRFRHWIDEKGAVLGTSPVLTVNMSGHRTVEAVYARDVGVPPTAPTYTAYFAEGATIGGFFETRLALLNPDPTADATVLVNFQLKDTTKVLHYTLTVPAQSRRTIDVGKLGTIDAALAMLASAEFSTVIRSDLPLVADRTMTWDGNGYGSHAERSLTAPASLWYLAEGATTGGFEEYILIQNPNSEPLTDTIEITYLLPPPAAPIVRTYSMGANTRRNIAVHAEPGLENVEVSAIIRTPSDRPVVVERAMYLSGRNLLYAAGHESAGITALSNHWFFAEGATGAFFDEFILIGNPTATTAHAIATFLFDDGSTCSTTSVVGPMSRYSLWVDATVIPGCPRDLADAAVSTTIASDVPVMAERAMWWPGPTPATWTEAHNAAGATETGPRWGFADGEQGGARGHETYILIANTSPYGGNARVTLYLEDGPPLVQHVMLPANSRTNVAVGAATATGGFGPGIGGKRFGAVIESLPVTGQNGPAQIVVERAMYSNGPGAASWAAGTAILATRLP